MIGRHLENGTPRPGRGGALCSTPTIGARDRFAGVPVADVFLPGLPACASEIDPSHA